MFSPEAMAYPLLSLTAGELESHPSINDRSLKALPVSIS
jgi:hypothetical protein